MTLFNDNRTYSQVVRIRQGHLCGATILPTTDKCLLPGYGEDGMGPCLGEGLAQSKLQCFFSISTYICLWCSLPPFWIISRGPDLMRTQNTHVLSKWGSSLFSFVPVAPHITKLAHFSCSIFDSARESRERVVGSLME